jgi:uncharacterized DUF497 family protein
VVVSGFEWDDDNIFHKRYIALGETLDGRLAFVVFRWLSGGLVRVITARDMDANERRLFRRK